MTPAHFTFNLPRALVLNANTRTHWAPKAQVTKQLRTMAAREARFMVLGADHADLVINVGWPDKRNRDRENISPTVKALVDGIVGDSRLLPDDSDRHILSTKYESHVAGLPGITVIELDFWPREVAA
jgi:crossover junction endodeoxyribonuclease RusA